MTEKSDFPAKEQATAVLATEVQGDATADPVGDTQEPVETGEFHNAAPARSTHSKRSPSEVYLR